MTTKLINRVRWHAYRTPLAGVVKSLKKLTVGADLAKRKKLLNQLPHDAEIDAASAVLNCDGFVRVDHLVDRPTIELLQRETERSLGMNAPADTFVSAKGSLWDHAIASAMVSGRLDAGSAFARAALQPKLLSVVAHALEALPRLDYVTVVDSKPMVGDPAHSQLWHRDHDDLRVIKLFVYLTDVDTVDDGPFTFIPGPASDSIGFSVKSHRRDDQMPAHVDLEQDVVRVTGKRFTAFMVETTRCQHMGSRVAPGHRRLMYTATFFLPPRIYPEPKPFFLPTGEESELNRLVLMAQG